MSNLAGNIRIIRFTQVRLFFFSNKKIDIHRKKGNHNEARDLYLKSLKQVEAHYGDNHPSVADIMNNLGMLTKKEGKYNEAINYLKQAIKISRHYYGREHPSIGIYLTNIGDVYRKVRKITLMKSFLVRSI